jgi:hypothetical protein
MGVEFPSKYALLIATKKNPSFIPSCASNIPYDLLKYDTPPKKGGMRDATIGVFLF